MSSPSSVAWIALGSNLGDRRQQIEQALLAMPGHGISVDRVSPWHETAPVGGPPGQGPYLNGVAKISTGLSPRGLLEALHEIEASLHRVREQKDGPRTIDLDVLTFGDAVIDEQGLTIPHPRIADRRFVLEPLAEAAPEWRHPVFQESAQGLLDSLERRTSRTPSLGRELAGLRAMVTGSTSGIGRAIALELSAAGADVIVHGRRSRANADAVAAECSERSHVLMADCGDPAACEQLVDDAWRLWHGLDIWIHNAGADTLTGPAARESFETKLETLYAVDVRGTMLTTRRIGRLMKQRGQGTIITIGWDQAETGMEGDSGQLFAATKGAVMAFTKSLSMSLAPQVRVNCLAPGWIRTAWGEGASNEWQERVRRETPLAVWGVPADIAAAARWLVSPAAKFITGQTIRVNGGAVRS